MLNDQLKYSKEVRWALEAGTPIIALESTIISHGMPYPDNLATARECERVARECGAVPATCAILRGKAHIGLDEEQLDFLARERGNVVKASRRDIPVLIARGMNGATTVAATMILASLAGIRVFATGGVGGVHRGAERTMDISADLEELANTPVAVVCAGPKSILDLPLTLEYLETRGVPVIGYGTDEMPAFYTRKSGLKVDYRMDTPGEIAAVIRTQKLIGYNGGMLVVNPIPEEFSMDPAAIDSAIARACAEAEEKGVRGKELTPYLLTRVTELTGGQSLGANIALVLNNVKLAAAIAARI
ncbi:MAG TPA: pseudouridine-5'-phosphate glycosidase [Clostridia bacterium]|nr:pseudouridine-5'-phosphate glycosidase [Clostridia bacterium]